MSKHSKICLFGGTFDPIHLGHMHIAQAAVDSLGLDKVIFLPCKQSPLKVAQAQASENDRLEMCRRATAGIDWAEVDDYDIVTKPPCYSWRTAESMTERFPDAEMFWLMGTDQWQALPHWNRPDHLAHLVKFIVYTRGEAPTPRQGYELHCINGNHPASATKIRTSMPQHLRDDWLSPDVAQYIKKHHLYALDHSSE
ncbi:MAG: nicotinate (nicotinamide) nucleotide adenylyltransferase [Akkermansiaceae bacterium]